jgi:hypothetical protein
MENVLGQNNELQDRSVLPAWLQRGISQLDERRRWTIAPPYLVVD